jgi:hypothetical protein
MIFISAFQAWRPCSKAHCIAMDSWCHTLFYSPHDHSFATCLKLKIHVCDHHEFVKMELSFTIFRVHTYREFRGKLSLGFASLYCGIQNARPHKPPLQKFCRCLEGVTCSSSFVHCESSRCWRSSIDWNAHVGVPKNSLVTLTLCCSGVRQLSGDELCFGRISALLLQ